MTTKESAEPRMIRVRVSAIIASDYAERRVAAKLLRTAPVKEEQKTGAQHFSVSALEAVEMYDDALEQLAALNGVEKRGLKIAYVAFRTQIEYWFRDGYLPLTREPGHQPCTLDPEAAIAEGQAPVEQLFRRLHIPPASPQP